MAAEVIQDPPLGWSQQGPPRYHGCGGARCSCGQGIAPVAGCKACGWCQYCSAQHWHQPHAWQLASGLLCLKPTPNALALARTGAAQSLPPSLPHVQAWRGSPAHAMLRSTRQPTRWTWCAATRGTEQSAGPGVRGLTGWLIDCVCRCLVRGGEGGVID